MTEARGRPSDYSEEIVAEICEKLSAGKSLKSICESEHMPSESTVRKWAIEDRNGFYANYARARDMGMDALAEETIQIADDGRNDTQIDEEGNPVVDHDHIRRSQLRVAARQWYVSKVAPKKYGESKTVTHAGEMTVNQTQLTPKQAADALLSAASEEDEEFDSESDEL